MSDWTHMIPVCYNQAFQNNILPADMSLQWNKAREHPCKDSCLSDEQQQH